jgi:hypothetical protein
MQLYKEFSNNGTKKVSFAKMTVAWNKHVIECLKSAEDVSAVFSKYSFKGPYHMRSFQDVLEQRLKTRDMIEPVRDEVFQLQNALRMPGSGHLQAIRRQRVNQHVPAAIPAIESDVIELDIEDIPAQTAPDLAPEDDQATDDHGIDTDDRRIDTQVNLTDQPERADTNERQEPPLIPDMITNAGKKVVRAWNTIQKCIQEHGSEYVAAVVDPNISICALCMKVRISNGISKNSHTPNSCPTNQQLDEQTKKSKRNKHDNLVKVIMSNYKKIPQEAQPLINLEAARGE